MAKENLILFGAGGLGRVMLFQMQDKAKVHDEYNILGFVDDTPEMQGKIINGLPVLGNTEWLQSYSKDVCVAICVAKPTLRKQVAEALLPNKHLDFPTLIADGTKLAPTVSFGKGSIISIYNIFTDNIQVGDFFFSSHFCMVGHDVRIGDFVTMYANVNIGGGTHIGSCCEFATGSIVMPRIKMGDHSMVGLGSALYHSIPPRKTVVGVPAKIKFSYDE